MNITSYSLMDVISVHAQFNQLQGVLIKTRCYSEQPMRTVHSVSKVEHVTLQQVNNLLQRSR